MTGGADQQPLAHHEIAFEAAAHLGIIDRCDAFEETGFGDIDVVAIVQIRFDSALDDEPRAGGDLTRQGNALSDNQLTRLARIGA